MNNLDHSLNRQNLAKYTVLSVVICQSRREKCATRHEGCRPMVVVPGVIAARCLRLRCVGG